LNLPEDLNVLIIQTLSPAANDSAEKNQQHNDKPFHLAHDAESSSVWQLPRPRGHHGPVASGSVS
jgi:hypothetical protein